MADSMLAGKLLLAVALIPFPGSSEPARPPAPISHYDTWTIAWDTTSIPNGTHVLTVVVRDAAGNTTESDPVVVYVDNVPSSRARPPRRGNDP